MSTSTSKHQLFTFFLIRMVLNILDSVSLGSAIEMVSTMVSGLEIEVQITATQLTAI